MKLTDNFGRSIDYLRLSVTDRCNLRCSYCMPEQGITKLKHEEILTLEELFLIAQAAVNLGIRKIRLTGGEPTVRLGLIELIEKLSTLPIEDLAMTTNGQDLAEKADKYKKAGLQRVNISIDSLDADRYRLITRGGELSKVLTGIEAALETGLQVKLNAVLLKETEQEIIDFVHLTEKWPVEVRFIELMPIGEALHLQSAFLPAERVLERVPNLKPLENRGTVAERYQVEGAIGSVGLIRPVSHAFCHACNRIRVTSDGRLKLCLHHDLQCDLRPAIREQNLEQAILACVARKPRQSDFREGTFETKEMVKIGG